MVRTVLPPIRVEQRDEMELALDHLFEKHALVAENLQLFTADINFRDLAIALDRADVATRAILYLKLALSVPEALAQSLLTAEVSSSSWVNSTETQRVDADPETGHIHYWGLSYESVPELKTSDHTFITSLLIDWLGSDLGKQVLPIIVNRSFSGKASKNPSKRVSRLWYYYKAIQHKRLSLDETSTRTIWLIESTLQSSGSK